jgi:hypothetical protein
MTVMYDSVTAPIAEHRAYLGVKIKVPFDAPGIYDSNLVIEEAGFIIEIHLGYHPAEADQVASSDNGAER